MVSFSSLVGGGLHIISSSAIFCCFCHRRHRRQIFCIHQNSASYRVAIYSYANTLLFNFSLLVRRSYWQTIETIAALHQILIAMHLNFALKATTQFTKAVFRSAYIERDWTGNWEVGGHSHEWKIAHLSQKRYAERRNKNPQYLIRLKFLIDAKHNSY